MSGISVTSQSFGYSIGSAVSVTIAAGSTVVVIATVQASGTFSVAGTCKDSNNTAYTNAATYSNSSYTAQVDVFYITNSAAATSITYTMPSGATALAYGLSIWVLAPTAGVIVFGSAAIVPYLANTTTATNGISTGNLSVSTASGIILGAALNFTAAHLSIGTTPAMSLDGSGFSNRIIAEHAAVSTASPCTWTDSAANETVFAAGISFNFYQWVRNSVGTLVQGQSTLSPTISGQTVGDLLILYAGESMQAQNGDSPPTVTGYTILNTGKTNQGIYGRIADGTSGDQPSVPAWTSAQAAYAFIVDYTCLAGTPVLTGIVHANNQRTNSTENNITYNALTITAANCLVIAVGQRGKTSATDANTFGSIQSNGGNFNIAYQDNRSGFFYELAYNDWIQTTPTSTLVGGQNSTPNSETSAIGYDTQVIALLTPSGSTSFAAGALSFAYTLESATLAAGGALSLAATHLAFTYTLENVTFTTNAQILAAAPLAFAYTLQANGLIYTSANFEFLMAPVSFFVDIDISFSGYQLIASTLVWSWTPQSLLLNAVTAAGNNPVCISDYTADSTVVTADSINFTCDGADLGNNGSVNLIESQTGQSTNRLAYSVSIPLFVQLRGNK